MHASLRGTDFECTFRHAENMAQVLNCFCWCQKFCRFFAFFPETSPFVSVAVMSSLSLMANKETRTILRFRNLLRTVIEDNLFASKSMCDDHTIHVEIPDSGDSWPNYHAADGSYHYGEVQTTRRDLLRLRDAWLRHDPKTTLPEASWLHNAVAETENMLEALAPRMLDLYVSAAEPRTSMDAVPADKR